MPHFLINTKDIENNLINVIDKELTVHLVSALRIKTGETVKFIDENEIVHTAKIIEIGKNKLTAEIQTTYKSDRKLGFDLCAVISILKPDAFNLAIQNAVQIGAKEIYPVFSDNCAIKKIDKKDKWQKIAMESFKQCERADIPIVYDAMSFSEIFSKFKKENIIIFAEKYAELTTKKALETINKNEKILAVFGPEGGFSEDEFNYFKNENIMLVTLGKLIFKAPNAITAGLYSIAENL